MNFTGQKKRRKRKLKDRNGKQRECGEIPRTLFLIFISDQICKCMINLDSLKKEQT
jgi:hypothetical protein